MAAAWVKSLQCKSNAIDDVVVFDSKPSKKKPSSLPIDCGNPSHALRDVVVLFPRPHNHSHHDQPPPPPKSRPKSHHMTKPKRKTTTAASSVSKMVMAAMSPTQPQSVAFPTLAELPPGHSSRRVVEIIFGSSWSKRDGAAAPFPGEIELLFRVHHPQSAVARFEEYRSAVRSRAAASNDVRCAADGNEMMRFHPAPSSSNEGYDAGWVCAVAASGKAGRGIRTFAGSGGAHESTGGGSGRRAMLVCRVIAGRVRSESEQNTDGSRVDSVSVGKGELTVLDPRAVLPCFLIIYKV